MNYMNYMKILFFLLISSCNAYNLCVVGGTSGLGRELIYQAISSNNKVLALTNNSLTIDYPYRGGGLNIGINDKKIVSENLQVDSYSNFNKYIFDNIVFTTGAGPFEYDYSDILTDNILNKLNSKLNGMVLVSAHGVGNSLKDSNIGIKLMDNIYLKDAYRAKNRQEKVVKKYGAQKKINTFIIRPKALSYGQNMYSIKSRQTLAKEILEYLYLL